MSDFGESGSAEHQEPTGDLRIGTPERQSALAALDVHREAGRLDSQEYEERTIVVNRARTGADLAAVFTDLPQPHTVHLPDDAASGGGVASTGAGTPQPVTGRPVGVGSGAVLSRWGSTVVALTPLVALLLFFATDSWLWFLAVPIVAIVVRGVTGDDPLRRARSRDGRRRRDC